MVLDQADLLDEFQPAPLTEARGDPGIRVETFEMLLFQSAPLTEARGDATQSSRVGTGVVFQSAPLTEARAAFWCSTPCGI